MRHLVVCCDGTWNSAGQSEAGVPTPTNVRLFHNALAATDRAGHEQVARYFDGVGADGSAVSRAIDGGTGHGLVRNIVNAYLWLATTWRPGDRIAAVGFSRGAYTARALVGAVGRCGLLHFGDADAPGDRWAAAEELVAEALRPAGAAGSDAPAARRERAPRRFHPGFGPGWADGAVPGERIEFVGVWDTVGALGIPDAVGVLEILDVSDHRFPDTQLREEVGVARHAMALDERRGPFVPTLWTGADGEPLQDAPRVVQRWFPGVHSDVGGGYRETGLSDGALRWMIGEAGSAVGLRFRTAVDAVRPDPLDVLHDSCTGLWAHLTSTPRAVPRLDAPTVHPSARRRARVSPVRQDPYRRTVVVGPHDAATGAADVLARSPWSDTGLFLEPGRYALAAAGEWADGDAACGPGGLEHAAFSRTGLLHALADAWGWAETAFRQARGRPGAEFVGTKRWEDAAWMELLAVVANGAGPDPGSRPSPSRPASPGEPVYGPDRHQYVRVARDGADVAVTRPGYLFAFANDAWGAYGNNRGSVRLTVTCRGPLDA